LGRTYRPIVLNWQSPREANFWLARDTTSERQGGLKSDS
jgi:hypothetical protein